MASSQLPRPEGVNEALARDKTPRGHAKLSHCDTMLFYIKNMINCGDIITF